MEQPSFGSSYDVFLSFRGEDVRKNFVDHLYSAMQQRGIYTFKDDEKLERGKSISPSLEKAIEESSMAVVVFSEHYADSSWCLDELVKIMECMEVKGQMVVPIFYGVDPSTVRKQKGKYGEAFEGHEKRFEKEGEKVKKWREVLENVSNLSGWDLDNTENGHEAKGIQRIIEDIMDKLGLTGTSDAPNLVGMESRMQKLYSLIGLGSSDVRFVGICGMSGIGKTTIARAVYDKNSSKFGGASFIHEVREQSAKHGLERLQQTLLSEILSMKGLQINNVFEGTNMIRRRLRGKKVLIVLDDVDHIDQLESLAGNRDWFGKGSRIIITTKNKHLLVRHDVDRMYTMSLLDEDEGSQLFRQYAFKKTKPTKELEKLSIQVVRHAGGLPLALKVLGSFLYGRDIAEWRSEVDRLKEIPEDEILEKLKVSFHGLNKIDQKIFLDIACFFKGKKKASMTRILDSFKFHCVIGIKVLIEKCLITFSKGRILMHQLIQEMGWHIVRQEASSDLRRYSRLWLSQDISELLTGNEGTDKIEGVALNFRAATDVKISSEAFTPMIKLRLLKIHNANASQVPSFLPCELRWLDWHGYPSKCLPASFQGENLVGLKMQYSRVIQLWKGLKVLDNLKFINLSYSQKLIRTPDFTGIPNLERLILEECTSLVEIHASVGFLKNLVLLNLKHCINLKRLPKSIHLEKLKMLILSGCLKLQTFPEIAGHMACLLEVYAEATALRELPSSIDFLTHLSLINLSYCKHLASLPSSICRLKGLKTLILSGCSQFDKLPDELGQMDCLEVLYCDGTAIQKPPSSISLLKNLKTLSFRGCKPLASQSWCSSFLSWLLPGTFQDTKASPFLSLSGLSSLKKLDLSDCSMLDGGVPCDDLGVLSTLEELNLGKNKFVSIPAEIIAQLTRLKVLELVGCQKLEALPDLPSSITEVYADECTALKSNLDLLTKYPKLFRVSFTKCARLFQDRCDSHIVDALWQHLLKGLSVVDDDFSICLPGIEIPEWFTYKNLGPSIAVSLPQNWYNNKFMGFAVCVVSDLTSTSLSRSSNYLKTTHGIRVLFRFRTRGGRNLSYGIDIGSIGSDENVDSEHTCLAYVSFDSFWWPFNKMVHSPNEWCQIEVSADRFSRGHLILTGFGMRLVYEDDVKQSDEQQMNQNNSTQSDGKMGLFPAIYNGSKYVKKKRVGYYDFSRLPPEAQHQDS
ncbi:PREDICTED: TMV resistance protein N-like [Ipomoea nil]|uniref:TMV resistance protein N-like n=1 Tax=Ipomoea nil TaxID=35883 RepID=UPI000901C592|nr:PREDICTED: TMV resistance protein N-like [Ipomoea nil]